MTDASVSGERGPRSCRRTVRPASDATSRVAGRHPPRLVVRRPRAAPAPAGRDLPPRLVVRRPRRRPRADQRVPGGDHARRHAGAGDDRRGRHDAGVPQRVPPPRRAARRGLRDGPGAGVSLPLVGVPPRRRPGPPPRHGGRRPTSTRSSTRSTPPRSPPGGGSCSSARSPMLPRSTSARWPRPSAPTTSARFTEVVAGVDRAGLQLEGAGRELLGELPHAVGAPGADRAGLGLPHRERGRRVAGLGPPAPAPEPTEEVLATVRPGDPGWHEVANDQIDDVFIAGVYFTVWPNLLVSVFPRYLSAFWLTPTGPTSTRVDYLRAWHPSVTAGPPRRRPRGQPPGRGAGPRHLRGRAARVQRRHRHRRPALAGARDRCRPRPRVAAAGRRRRWLTVPWHRATVLDRVRVVRKASVEERRNEILETTCLVVIERGFAATRVIDVAQRLGVSTGLIHYHFDSKDHLLAEAFEYAAAHRPGPPRRRAGQARDRGASSSTGSSASTRRPTTTPGGCCGSTAGARRSAPRPCAGSARTSTSSGRSVSRTSSASVWRPAR